MDTPVEIAIPASVQAPGAEQEAAAKAIAETVGSFFQWEETTPKMRNIFQRLFGKEPASSVPDKRRAIPAPTPERIKFRGEKNPTKTEPKVKKEAEAKPEEDAAKEPAPGDDLFEYAGKVYGQKYWDLAIEKYRLYLERHPKGHHAQAALYRTAESYRNLSMAADASATFKKLLKLYDSGSYVGLSAYRLASIHYTAEQHKEATPYFKIAAEKAENDAVRYSSLYYAAYCLEMTGQFEESRETYDKLLGHGQVDNKWWDQAMLAVAKMDLKVGDKRSALEAFENIVKRGDPNAQEAAFRAATIRAELGETVQAVALFEKVLLSGDRRAEWMPQAGLELIRLHHELSQFDKVIATYSRLYVPRLKESELSQTKLRVGEAYRARGDFKKAHALFKELENTSEDAKLKKQASEALKEVEKLANASWDDTEVVEICSISGHAATHHCYEVKRNLKTDLREFIRTTFKKALPPGQQHRTCEHAHSGATKTTGDLDIVTRFIRLPDDEKKISEQVAGFAKTLIPAGKDVQALAAVLTAPQAEELLTENKEAFNHAEILSLPAKQERLLFKVKDKAEKEAEVPTFPSIWITPALGDDGVSVELEIHDSATQGVTTSATVWIGQTAVLAIRKGEHRYLAMITPSLRTAK